MVICSSSNEKLIQKVTTWHCVTSRPTSCVRICLLHPPRSPVSDPLDWDWPPFSGLGLAPYHWTGTGLPSLDWDWPPITMQVEFASLTRAANWGHTSLKLLELDRLKKHNPENQAKNAFLFLFYKSQFLSCSQQWQEWRLGRTTECLLTGAWSYCVQWSQSFSIRSCPGSGTGLSVSHPRSSLRSLSIQS